jgi:cold shock CspA family protein
LNALQFPISAQRGTVIRLNLSAGFGYVRDDSGCGTFVFVADLVSHRVMRALTVGQAVLFDLDDRGRVVSLVPAQGR